MRKLMRDRKIGYYLQFADDLFVHLWLFAAFGND